MVLKIIPTQDCSKEVKHNYKMTFAEGLFQKIWRIFSKDNSEGSFQRIFLKDLSEGSFQKFRKIVPKDRSKGSFRRIVPKDYSEGSFWRIVLISERSLEKMVSNNRSEKYSRLTKYLSKGFRIVTKDRTKGLFQRIALKNCSEDHLYYKTTSPEFSKC